MKNIILYLIFFLPLSLYCQYLEDFNIAERGVLNAVPFTVDYSGVNWTITQGTGPNPGGIAAGDYFKTIGGSLTSNDVDVEYCLILPKLWIGSSATPRVINVAFTAPGFEFGDYIQLDYKLNNSSTWVAVPNQFGGGVKTVDMPSGASETTFNGTMTQGGLVGSFLEIRVCCNSGNSLEDIQLHSVSVPQAGTALPVKWTRFQVKSTEKGYSQLSWQTASEINNDYFEVERSTDAINYISLGQVKGNGNTPRLSNYEYIDETAIEGNTYYYRIRQVDFDGQYDYSTTLSIQIKGFDATIKMSPNPTNNILDITLSKSLEQNLDLEIINIDGKIVHTFTILEGEHYKNIDISILPAGTYLLRSKDADIIQQKIIKSN